MKHITRCALCVLAAVLMLFSFALAAPRYPARQGSVTDNAMVLSSSTMTNLQEVIRDIQEETDESLLLVTVDFLDGYTMQAYMNGLRSEWALPENSILLLLAVGEHSLGCSVGSDVLLSASVVEKLMRMHIEPRIASLDYNSAMYDFIPALLTEVNKAYGTRLSADAFGMPAVSPEPFSYEKWLEEWTFGISGHEQIADPPISRSDDDDDDISFGKIILTLVLLSVFFGGKRSRRRHGGCGCSPLSRLLAALGLWKLWDRD